MKPKNARLDVTTITQTANELLGKKEQKLYYLIVETERGKMTINVGEKTHNEINKLTQEEELTLNKLLEKEKPNDYIIKGSNKLMSETNQEELKLHNLKK